MFSNVLMSTKARQQSIYFSCSLDVKETMNTFIKSNQRQTLGKQAVKKVLIKGVLKETVARFAKNSLTFGFSQGFNFRRKPEILSREGMMLLK